MKISLLLKGAVVATTLAMTPFKTYSMPQGMQDEMRQLVQKGDYRQALQMGVMLGMVSSFCIIHEEGFVHPEEGPVTEVQLNDFTSKLMDKTRAEFDDYLFEYQRMGMNVAIMECNKKLGLKLEYR